MPITVEVPGRGVAEFPDNTPSAEIESALAEAFPATGEEIYTRLTSEPDYEPTKEEYAEYEKFAEQKKTDWASAISSGVATAGNILAGGAKEAAKGAILNPANWVEAFSQGTRALAGILTQSTDPSSIGFKVINYLDSNGTLDDRYNQFVWARKFAARSQKLDSGEENLAVPKEYTNPEFVRAASLIADPSLFLPGLGEVAGLGKFANRLVGAGTKGAGKTVSAIAKPLEAGIKAGEEFITEAAGTTPGAMHAAMGAAGLTSLAAGVPGGALVAAAPAGVKLARGVGEALETAGENLGKQPSRIGPLESVGLKPDAGKIDKLVGAAGKLGGDATLDLGLRATAGAIEGSMVGGVLGYWNAGEEGAASGVGFGSVLGATGAGAVRLASKASGRAAKQARIGDLERLVNSADKDSQQILVEMVNRDGVEDTIGTLDTAALLRGPLQDIDVQFLRPADYEAQFGNTRGATVELGDRPKVIINTGKLKNKTTIGHELFHSLEKVEQLNPEVSSIKRQLIGSFDAEGKQIAPGLLPVETIRSLFESYQKKLPKEKADDLAAIGSTQGKADFIWSEAAAEYMGSLLASSHPDAMLRGFDGVTRRLLDRALLDHSRGVLARVAERLGKEKSEPSILFGKELPDAPPALKAALRDLVRARKNLNERVEMLEARADESFKRSEPISAARATELAEAPIPVVKRNVDGTYTIRSDAEMAIEEQKFKEAIRQSVARVVPADPTKPFMREVDGLLVGERFSPEQLSAIMENMTLPDKVKEVLRSINTALEEGNVLDVRYGPATRKHKGRTRYATVKIGNREIVPYKLYQNRYGDFVVKGLRVTAVKARAQKMATRGSLGPYGSSFDGFIKDFIPYLENLSSRSPVPTTEFFKSRGDSASDASMKAAYLHEFLGDNPGNDALVHDYRLDRVVAIRPTGDKLSFKEEAWAKMRARFMPAERIGDTTVISSDLGFRIIEGLRNWRLYTPDGELYGRYESQEAAERVAEKIAPKYNTRISNVADLNNTDISSDVRFMPDTFFSQLQRVVESEKFPKAATVEQVRGILKNPQNAIKADELKWSGIEQWLQQKGGRVTKAEVMDFLRANELKVEEVQKGQPEKPVIEWQKDGEVEYAFVGDNEYSIEKDVYPREGHPDVVTYIVKLDSANSIRPAGRSYSTASLDDAKQWVQNHAKDRHVATKFEQYQLPGGENYRELLFTLPKGTYKSSHWDEKGVLAHARFNERTDADGKRVLFLEEIQSDWHQEGRKKGYRDPNPPIPELNVTENGSGYWDVENKLTRPGTNTSGSIVRWNKERNRFDEKGDLFRAKFQNSEKLARTFDEAKAWIQQEMAPVLKQLTQAEESNRPPDAPFKNTWHEFTFKRMLRWAAENGFDRVAWTPGEMQASRYDLSKHIDRVKATHGAPERPSQVGLDVVDKSGRQVLAKWVHRDQVADFVGKELAEKIIAQDTRHATYEGLDLKVGGEGMKGFYDKILVDFARKYGKKWSATVQPVELSGQKVWGMDVTPAMKSSVLEGQPMFMPDASVPGAETLDGYRILPSGQKNFRIYSPTGALLGIASGQEKARRLVLQQREKRK